MGFGVPHRVARMDAPAGISLGEQAYAVLRKEIVSLGLAPGAEVSEQRLVSEFGLSRAAVRAALARLRAEGLITSVPRRGHFVSVITLRDVDEVFRLRLLLEPEAAALAAGRIGEAELRALREVADRRYDVGSRESISRFLAANRELHVRVAAASGNGRLARWVGSLLEEAERASHLALAAGAGERGLRIVHEHGELIEALVAGDAAGARRYMVTALESFHRELRSVLLDRAAVLDTAL
jgi:DNA-binding GntR family transcriptional regulator